MAGLKRSLGALATLGVLMGGCAAGPSVLTTLPEALPDSMGGLPSNAPAAPKTPYQFPAVHDMPPARPDAPMNNDQLQKMQTDLQSTRDQQVDRAAKAAAEDTADFSDPPAPAAAAPVPAKPAPVKPAKKKAAAKKTRAPAPQAGTATNP